MDIFEIKMDISDAHCTFRSIPYLSIELCVEIDRIVYENYNINVLFLNLEHMKSLS